MLLKTTFEFFRVLLVQLTGTMTANATNAMGTNIFSLHFNGPKSHHQSNKTNIENQSQKEEIYSANAENNLCKDRYGLTRYLKHLPYAIQIIYTDLGYNGTW